MLLWIFPFLFFQCVMQVLLHGKMFKVKNTAPETPHSVTL